MNDKRRYELVLEHIANARCGAREGREYVATMYVDWARELVQKMSEGSMRKEAARARASGRRGRGVGEALPQEPRLLEGGGAVNA